ncbi:ets DNA-binding protein pokkuri-like [Hyalella azteca]|uniref:Ets DNA-binding protein pokkuri-like n=1 Tax=Hyalella azteca TaxID=294128 RepID=A0A8B7N1S2_HYAAZ|nr:ets DNA-binding protein pokkuri-like [Hyalella azteca]
MKVPPLNLTPDMNRVGMSLPFSPELLWRSYPSMAFSQTASAAPPSPLDVKNQLDMKTLPSRLSLDPRVWSREEVIIFLGWVEREYDLPAIDTSKFCMNGKALMMLNKADLCERAPDAGDIVHNTLQQILGQSSHVPPSPLTPHHPMLSPSPLTTSAAAATSQTWSLMPPEFHNLSHLLQQNSSVTLSPAHSEQSGGSPRHPDNASTTSNGSAPGYPHSGSQSDSEDSTRDASSPQRSPVPAQTTSQSNFSVHALASFKQITDYQQRMQAAAAAAAAAVHSQHQEEAHHKHHLQQALQLQHQQQQQSQQSASQLHHHVSHQIPSHVQIKSRSSPPLSSSLSSSLPASSQQQQQPQSPDEAVEPGTNGRLLWDFLQQLLNDRDGRYARYIAWRDSSTGVFKIVDPPGLARLWGIQKNHLSMNYDKMSRALRYYYRVNILRKVQGERHCYQFLRNPTELRNIKNISSLKIPSSVSPQSPQRQHQSQQQLQSHQMPHQQALHMQQQSMISSQMVSEGPEDEEEEGPTDLSMSSLHHHHHHHSHHISRHSPQDMHSRRADSPQDMSVDAHFVKEEVSTD